MDADSRSSTVYLSDYTPFPYKLHETRLEFILDPKKTSVIAELDFEGDGKSDLILDGEELRLVSIAINGEELQFGAISIENNTLNIDRDVIPNGRFTLRTEVQISPEDNTALSGLYMSNGMYSTQCEAEGFRRITFYPDRPDVLSVFYVTIHSELPVRLSNGNKLEQGENVSKWHDPWPKPAYLFALVAGELEVVSDRFQTQSGREVALEIYVRKGDESRCDYAMDALKRSMAWDEKAYGREYDLDLFMIVAVDDFNMGAMENKGLNIFNSVLVLASPETATDQDYARIESVIAHEYFHNWTGNRVTCRDWFQLSLKEGLTVYRDQQFSAHERSAAVQRIEDVRQLRARQFPEDAGPLAHPVRPDHYIAIDNFYTATVYEKGAELIGMMHSLVGADDYRKALDLYFARHDGEAATIEDWLQVFADTTGRDLEQFKLWYSQSGTPRVFVDSEIENGHLRVSLRQELPPTPGQSKKKPQLIPLRYSVYAQDGRLVEDGMVEMSAFEQFFDVKSEDAAVLSINQGFSAPVHLKQSPYDAAFLLRHDQDPFNRWEAGRRMALDILAHDADPAGYVAALENVISDSRIEPAYRAHLLSLPDFNEVLATFKLAGMTPDPEAMDARRTMLAKAIGAAHKDSLAKVYQDMRQAKGIDADAAGQRTLALAALRFLSEADLAFAKAHFAQSHLMTDKIAALAILISHDDAVAELAQFYDEFAHERLVVDKWFGLQAANSKGARAIEIVTELSGHEAFANANPNRFRALFGGFSMSNLPAFHHASGEGYRLMADKLIEYDQKNPQIAARLSGAFQSWHDFDAARQAHAKAELERIAAATISDNLREMIERMLG